MKKSLPYLLVCLLLLSILNCTSESDPTPCVLDDDCDSDAYCGNDGTCLTIECDSHADCVLNSLVCTDELQCEQVSCLSSYDCPSLSACGAGGYCEW